MPSPTITLQERHSHTSLADVRPLRRKQPQQESVVILHSLQSFPLYFLNSNLHALRLHEKVRDVQHHFLSLFHVFFTSSVPSPSGTLPPSNQTVKEKSSPNVPCVQRTAYGRALKQQQQHQSALIKRRKKKHRKRKKRLRGGTEVEIFLRELPTLRSVSARMCLIPAVKLLCTHLKSLTNRAPV
ncbi:hypothetical protein NPIL_115591 [Nephila pilipes]|uniref:Uncharacterized protein n=1 Tax=Nephila pilipes TaxID=299642 RepID=A0A8X6QKJ2_NEPPI|nr:hypothetical protein NPIL_115591 [Nephila pilipes]